MSIQMIRLRNKNSKKSMKPMKYWAILKSEKNTTSTARIGSTAKLTNKHNASNNRSASTNTMHQVALKVPVFPKETFPIFSNPCLEEEALHEVVAGRLASEVRILMQNCNWI